MTVEDVRTIVKFLKERQRPVEAYIVYLPEPWLDRAIEMWAKEAQEFDTDS